MIHFTCDGCDRRIDTAHEPRFILRMEVYAAPEFSGESCGVDLTEDFSAVDADRDHLAEIEDLLEQVDGFADEPLNNDAEEYRQVRYDVCGECRKRMLSNPLARLSVSKIDFSEN